MEVVRCHWIRTSQAASGEACWLGSKMMIISREHQSKKPVNLRPCSDHRYVHPRTAQYGERRHLASWYGNAVCLAFVTMCLVLMYTYGHTPTTGLQKMHQIDNRGEVLRRFNRESTPRDVGTVRVKSITNSGHASSLPQRAQGSSPPVAEHEHIRRKHGGARGID